MKKVLSVLLILTMIVTVFSGCSSSVTPEETTNTEKVTEGAVQGSVSAAEQSAEVIPIKIGVSSSAETLIGQAAQKWADLVNERLAGQVEVSVYPNELLGNNDTMMENMQGDLQQAIASTLDNYSQYCKDLNIMTMAFAFDNVDHLNAFLRSEVADGIWKDVYDAGFYILSFNFNRNPRCFISKTPIYSMADMKGIKWRVPSIAIYEKNFTAMGATPIVTSWNDLPYSLMTGLVDACETSWELVYPNHLHEHAPYITLSEYAYAKESLAINTQTWEKLTAEQQKVLHECADEAAAFYNENVGLQWEEHKVKIVEEGGTIITQDKFDRGSYTEAIAKYAQQLEKDGFWKTKGLYDYVRNLKY